MHDGIVSSSLHCNMSQRLKLAHQERQTSKKQQIDFNTTPPLATRSNECDYTTTICDCYIKQQLRNMDKFVTSIKRKYRERLLQRERQWPPVSLKKLVNLQLVEAEKKMGFRAGLLQHGATDDKVKRSPILHGDLFKVEEEKQLVRKLIVEGNAGIGKTTLCTMLTAEWANGEILTQFDCVLLLPLRERSVSIATTLPQLFKLLHSSERIRTSVIEELEEREGEGVLIIADGWDELDEDNRSDTSFLHNLLFGNILPFASVLLTSRPAASAPLHNLPTVDRLVEVVGFNEENVKQYIESEFEKCPEKASSLIEQLEDNPLIASVCSVPLNCAIVCNVWQTLDSTLPSTLTELYAQIVLNFILRNLKKSNFLDGFVTLSFDSIPENLHDMFWLMCKFAYECLSQDKIVFSEKEIAHLFPQILDSSDKLLCFGLLQCARSLLPVGQGLSFHFVHLTIQEFLAALHLVTLPNEEKLKVCEAYSDSNRFAMVWRFVFGLGCQEEGSYSRKVVCLDDEVINKIVSRQKDLSLVLCHCAMESQSGYVSAKIGKQINGKFEGHYFSIASTPHDCVAVLHVLRHTSHCFDMSINLSNCELTDKLLTELTDILSSAGSELQVRELTLIGRKITDNCITDLFNRASASFPNVKELMLPGNKITDKNITDLFKMVSASLERLDLTSNGITSIPQLFFFNNLTYLSLSYNPLGVSGIQSLETAVQAGVLVNIEILNLSNTLTDDADINGALLATLSHSIASHCPNLCKLDLSRNNLGVPGASALSGPFISNRNRLGLDENTSNTNADTAIFSVSHNPYSYNLLASVLCNSLKLSNANFNAEAVASLNISSKLSRDCELDLSSNPLGYDGLLAIFRMLRSETCPITSLHLTDTEFTTPVNIESQYHNTQLPKTSSTLAIKSSVLNLGPVVENSILTELNLYSNNFSGDKFLILAECVRVCQSLERLYCSHCSLTSNEIIKILGHLKSNCSSHKLLRTWNLNNNSIGDEGVNALIDSLPQLFPKLEEMSLVKNLVSGEAKQRLEKILKVIIKFLNLFSFY